ncbi:hypothetical protein Y032_0065g3643 [Ancylostoma ceylanicum]|uniref:Uncharacterized protein n=1 Tax=Ancylostoma ceylanicum TaxID=53326 RepID=A0A016TZZ4_9BILA|nr:hypothetical protein Y032_0065g3643 [Ancylostoma ceylanicum]
MCALRLQTSEVREELGRNRQTFYVAQCIEFDVPTWMQETYACDAARRGCVAAYALTGSLDAIQSYSFKTKILDQTLQKTWK